MWKSLEGKEALDQFFANYEIDPDWLIPDGNPTEEQIRMYDDYDEAKRQAIVVTELEHQIMKNLDQTADILMEVMKDPSFELMGTKMLTVLNVTRKQMQDLLNEKKEEIVILTHGFCPFVE